jgi:hypothetical protein
VVVIKLLLEVRRRVSTMIVPGLERWNPDIPLGRASNPTVREPCPPVLARSSRLFSNEGIVVEGFFTV